MNSFTTELIHASPHHHARVLKVNTPHGEIKTPAFMPVGTRAFVNHLTPAQLLDTGSQIILGGNTYHMLCHPGMERIHQAGGMHSFMGWQGPMLTDSGGYQIFSLSKNSNICTLHDWGASFKHPDTGKVITMTPEIAIKTQQTIGADIIMAFDQCTPHDGERTTALAALEKTHRWLLQSKAYHDRHPYSDYGKYQALFGIIQGGAFQDLRQHSAEFVVNLDLDGVAIGGEVIGADMAMTAEIIHWIHPLLPKNKVRYTMGVGLSPQDLFDVVALGIDIFDCVAPTRNARHGALYAGRFVDTGTWWRFEPLTEKARILIKKTQYASDDTAIMPDCDCYTCCHFSRAYLHYLFKMKAVAYGNLACIHNVRVMQKACELMRQKILLSA